MTMFHNCAAAVAMSRQRAASSITDTWPNKLAL